MHGLPVNMERASTDRNDCGPRIVESHLLLAATHLATATAGRGPQPACPKPLADSPAHHGWQTDISRRISRFQWDAVVGTLLA